MADEKPEEPKAPTMEERLAALEADLKAERDARAKVEERAGLLDRTLQALGRDRQPEPQRPAPGGMNMNVPPPGAQEMEQLRRMYPGTADAELVDAYQKAGMLLAMHAGPLVQNVYGVLGQAANEIDRHNALLDLDDYKPNRKEVEELRTQYEREGRQIPPRKELVEIVKARKLPELVQAQVESRLAAEKERTASAHSSVTEGVSVEKAGPSAVRAPTKKLTDMTPAEREAATANMSREDRIKALEEAAGDTPVA